MIKIFTGPNAEDDSWSFMWSPGIVSGSRSRMRHDHGVITVSWSPNEQRFFPRKRGRFL